MDQNGRIITEIKADKLQLIGEYSIIGRSVVLHERIDDLGKGNVPASLLNGNAGKIEILRQCFSVFLLLNYFLFLKKGKESLVGLLLTKSLKN